MASKVFFGTARQARLEAKETLPAKLDLILEQLHLRDRVDKETVVIKMHTGNNMVYSTIHPVFVRRVVQAIKDGGGKPFVVDVNSAVTPQRCLAVPSTRRQDPTKNISTSTSGRIKASKTGRSPD